MHLFWLRKKFSEKPFGKNKPEKQFSENPKKTVS